MKVIIDYDNLKPYFYIDKEIENYKYYIDNIFEIDKNFYKEYKKNLKEFFRMQKKLKKRLKYEDD